MWPKQKRRLHRIEKELSYLSVASQPAWKMSNQTFNTGSSAADIYCDNIIPFTSNGQVSVLAPGLIVNDLSVRSLCSFVNNVPECDIDPQMQNSLVNKKYVDNSFLGCTTTSISKLITEDVDFDSIVIFKGLVTQFRESLDIRGNTAFAYHCPTSSVDPISSTGIPNKGFVGNMISSAINAIYSSSSLFTGQNTFSGNTTFAGGSQFVNDTPSCNLPPTDSSSLTNKEYVDAYRPFYTGFSVGSLGSLFNFKIGDTSINGVISTPYVSPFFILVDRYNFCFVILVNTQMEVGTFLVNAGQNTSTITKLSPTFPQSGTFTIATRKNPPGLLGWELRFNFTGVTSDVFITSMTLV